MGYCTVADIRLEGVDAVEFPDPVVLRRIELSRELFDRFTGTWFEARAFGGANPRPTMELRGAGTRWVYPPAPIISIVEVRLIDFSGTGSPTITVLDPDEFIAHDSVLAPDDRSNPRFERVRGIWKRSGRPNLHGSELSRNRGFGATFPTDRDALRAGHNIEVDGTFGYLEYDHTLDDGTLRIPVEIRDACIKWVIANLDDRSSASAADALRRGDLRSRRVANRAETYGGTGQGNGSLTGLIDVDRVLYRYMFRRGIRARAL